MNTQDDTSQQFTTKPSFWQKLIKLIGKHRNIIIFLVVSVLIIAALTSFYVVSWLASKETITNQDSQPTAIVKPKPQKIYSLLNGALVTDKKDLTKPVTAVMIENSPAARPQSGLAEAEVVYEAVAEGGITRFMAIYQQNKPPLLGPVRSVRPYFVDWYAPYDASIAHVGGSKQALAIVRSGKYRDIDQFFNAGYYWRSSDRYAPHNMYTSFKKLDKLNAAKGYKKSEFTSFARKDQTKYSYGKPKDDKTTKSKPANSATRIKINFSSALYNTTYKYDSKKNTYTRYLAGQPHKDREKGSINPSVIVALKVNMQYLNDASHHEKITTTGKGGAIIFQDGVAQKAIWKKSGRDGRLQLVDKAGKDIKLNRGQTWIAAVPVNRQGSLSWE